jgi:hypothetical protein
MMMTDFVAPRTLPYGGRTVRFADRLRQRDPRHADHLNAVHKRYLLAMDRKGFTKADAEHELAMIKRFGLCRRR